MKRLLYYVILFSLVLISKESKSQFQIGPIGRESLLRVGMNPHPKTEKDSIYADSLYRAISNNDIIGIHRLKNYYSKMALIDSLKEKSYGSIAYLLGRWISEKNKEYTSEEDILANDMYLYFMSNNCSRLKDYLRQNIH